MRGFAMPVGAARTPGGSVRALIASCGHKGYLSPGEASRSIARGLRRGSERFAIEIAPMADGGDGTIEVLVSARGGRVVEVSAHDPLFRPRRARLGLLDGTPAAAVIEISEAAGWRLLRPHERQTMVATSYGVGELILAAVARGYRRIIVGLGGSIVSDMGIGMAQALGVEFLDRRGAVLRPIGTPGFNALSLVDIAGVRLDRLKVSPGVPEIVVASDADIPLLGPRGQARSFGPQKGASVSEIAYLDAGFANLARVLRRQTGRRVDVPLAGAAGGLGAGLLGFLGATLVHGAELVEREIGLAAWIKRHDVVIIGEGRLDRTTLLSKGPAHAGAVAKRLGRRVVAVVGTVEPGFRAPFYDEVIACDGRVRPGELSAALIRDRLERAVVRAAPGIARRAASASRNGRRPS